MPKRTKAQVKEIETSKGVGYLVSFPITVKKTDSPSSVIEEIDANVTDARNRVIEQVFEKMGINVKWSN